MSKIKSLALLAVIPFMLTACTVADLPVIGKLLQGKDKPVTLKVWGLWEPVEVMQPVIDDYQKAHPNVTIQYESRSFVTLRSYKESVFTRLSEGSAPDVVLIHNSWTPYLVKYLAPAPSKVFAADTYANTFYPVAKESGVFDSKIYAAPFGYDGLALVYNKDMLTEAGISEPPTTWEEFRVAAAKLTKRASNGTLDQAGAAIGTANNIEHFSDILGLLFAQGGVNVPADFSSQAAADVMSFYTNFATQERVWNDTLPGSVDAFSQKKVAMIFAPSWEVLNILNKNSQLNVGIAAVPRALDLSGNPIVVDWGSFWMNAVAKNSTSADTAWDFVKFMSEDASQRKIFSEQAKLRAFGVPYSTKTLQGELSNNAYLDPYLKSAPNAKSGILAAGSGNDKEVEIMRTAVNSVISGTGPLDALATAQRDLSGQ